MSEWHVPERVATAFATAPRTLDAGVAASVEQHVVSCAECRATIADAGADFDFAAVWADIEDGIDRRHLGWFGRLAGRSVLGQLLAATPGLRVSALGAVALIVAAASLAASRLDASGVFLAIAPLVPLALVAVSFAPGADPSGEAGLAAPLYGIGLLVRRLLAIGVVSAVVLTAGTLALPLDGLRAVAWVLPSVALSAVTVAGGVRWPTPRVACAAAAAWAAAVLGAARLEPQRAVASSLLFDAAGQVLFAGIFVAALLVIASKRDVVCQEVL